MKINITKRFLLSLCLMTLTLLCGGNKAWGQTTATLTFGTNNVKINAANVSAKDTQGNAWTITTKGTTSFTQNSAYSQVGSGDKPATSITFTTTLSSESSITGFSAKFGGFKGTAGTISLKVDDTKVGSGSLNASNDVTVKNTSTQLGQKLTITITGIAKGVKCYNISVTYQEANPAPTFSLPGGTYYGDQSVSISVADLGSGSIFYTTDDTDPKTNGTKYTEAIPLPVGTKLTLKAVAKYGEEFSEVTEATYDIQKASSTFFQRITSAAELTANETYLIVCERKSESVAFGKISNKKGSKQDVTITGDKINLSAAGTGTPTEFILEVSGNNYKLKNASTGEYLNFKSSSTDITETASGTALSISFDNAKGNVKIAGATISTRQLIYRASTYNVFGNYGNDNIDDSEYNKVYLYKKHIVKEFSDTEDLATSLPTSPLADQTVTLNRNLYSGWNTFCVPFALTQAQLEEAYGSGAVAKYLSNVTTDGAAATLHFTPEEKDGIEANKAYLLYLTADVTEAKTFSGVTLQPAGTCTTTVRADNGDDYTFQGILAPTKLTTTDTQYFLNSAGTDFVLPINNTNAMKATRAYIIVPDAPGSAQSRQYSFDFNGTTTGIDNVNISGLEDGGAWYTISGIRVNRPAAKGVYIHNGRKVIVK